MLITIKGLLNQTEIQTIQQLLMQGVFLDGKLSAGREAKAIKANLELDNTSQLYQKLNQLIMNKLIEHPEFQRAVLPLKVATPFYVRYTEGMHYGEHVDDPVMGPMGQQYRSDVSTTIFLNSPDEYKGGELLINTSYGSEALKLNAGDVVVYSSTSLHEVKKITAGQRLAAVIWSQSMVADERKREILYQLSNVRDACQKKVDDAISLELTEEVRHLSHIYSNLVRMWSEV